MDLYDVLVTLLLFGTPLAYVVAQIRAAALWSGGLRFAALIPLAGWALWSIAFVVDLAKDPTSHNLFPFEVLIGALLSLAYLGALKIARLVVR